jgi:hypothetical protein
MTEAPRRRLRRPPTGAVVACGLLLAACATAGTAATPSADVSPAAATTTLSAAVDGASILANALAAYQPGYAFSSRVVVNGAEALTVSGRTMAGSSEMLLRSGDGGVEYVIVGEGQWARTPGGTWDLVSDGGSAPPLDPLASPDAVRVVSEGAGVLLEATYPAAEFGLSGADLVVTLTIEEGLLVSARYAAEEDGARAEVETSFEPATDTTPITAPAA